MNEEIIEDCEPKFKLPEIGEKNLAMIVLGVISLTAMFTLGKDGIPIVTACAGAIGGFVYKNARD